MVALGLILTGAAFYFTAAAPLRKVWLTAGLIVAGGAVARRLQSAGQNLDDRVESAGLLAVASLSGLLAGYFWALGDVGWDSMLLLIGALVVIALVGSVLVLLPRTPRRILASFFVLFHFGGIATAVTAVAPPNASAPWLSMQLWTRVYRPYLQFMYLTNAYHFYSPDPGPPTMIWFWVEYANGDGRWIKLPVRDEMPIALAYQRLLALGESINVPNGRLPFTEAEKAEWQRHTGQVVNHDSWEEIYQRRTGVGLTMTTPPILMPQDIAPNVQYVEPQDHAKMLISSYARHVARTAPHPVNPEVPVKSVRVYRVVHRIISPSAIAQRVSPLDETLYSPYYQGKFDSEGHLLDPQDPFLYWYLPIAWVPPTYGTPGVPLLVTREKASGDVLLNSLKIHAGDPSK
jgi:hypothetical protein